MKYRLLVLGLALVIAALVAIALLPDHELQGALLERAVQATKLLAAVGALLAALSFEPGDYLRRAWGLQALNMILLMRDLPMSYLPKTPLAEFVNMAIVAIANVLGLGSCWLMARAWQVSGLKPPGPPWRRRLIVGVALALAIGISGAPLARAVLSWNNGLWTRHVIQLVSGVSDTVSICLIAPVLLTVLAMRGGLLAWPFGFYLAAMVCWLVYDLGDVMTQIHALHGHKHDLQMVRDSMRVIACVLTFSAGLAQRFVVTGVREAAGTSGEPEDPSRLKTPTA